ncbi:hypothetical protein BDB00DRAFT_212945 [Zychaea mexicana]|uniref:uncharacterized protein n=1 Tax=Zychaea mexicana TaxID=64656 RepID=UPI0022FEE051|nr:uncharacterized protein BDB00DRAFT_212945 [Zychaea mexicana]KAI9495720.1 hypothetical protein BDB00DRAFT_212945 [Zychaea mexicana]
MMTPNLVMREGGEIVSLGGDSPYKVMTFNTCNDRNCPVDGALSDPTGIFFNDGNFNGPSGDVPSQDDTIVFNIPVTDGSTLRLTGNQPSQGFYACRTIYNFYPVNEDGQFVPGGTFTLVRETGSQLEGFSLAPRGHIRDGLTGNFAGTIIGLDYTWEYFPQGVEIHDYPAANCANFQGCLPINPGSPNTTTTTTTTSRTTDGGLTVTATTTNSITITKPTTTTITENDGTTVTVTDQETVYINDPWEDEWKKKKKWGKKGSKWEKDDSKWGKDDSKWEKDDSEW